MIFKASNQYSDVQNEQSDDLKKHQPTKVLNLRIISY